MARTITVSGRTIEISNPDKVLFPEDGITKRDLIDYYQRISERMLPHIRGRPLTLVRYPNGIRRPGFFQKDVSDYFPSWLERVRVKKEGGYVTHPLCDSAAGLAYLANQATITLHVWMSRVGKLHNPDLLVLDIDPPGADFGKVRSTARLAKALLEELGLRPYVQTTGSRGLHVAVALDGRATYPRVRAFSRDAARVLALADPLSLTTEERKKKREERVFLDTGRNAYAQTIAAPYTVRALPGAPVATPLDWSELGKGDSQRFNMRNIFRRLGRKGDPWDGMWSRPCSITEARRRLDAMLPAKGRRQSG